MSGEVSFHSANCYRQARCFASNSGNTAPALKAPAAKLVVAGELRREGQKRGTKYFVGGGRRTASRKPTKAARRTRKAGRPARAKRTAPRVKRARALAAKPAGYSVPAEAKA
jgi:hypothetical protein